MSEAGRGGIPLRKIEVPCSDDVADSRLRTVGLTVRLPKTSVASRTHCTSIYAAQDTTPSCFCFPGYSTTIKDTIGAVLIKLKFQAFINIVLAVSIFS